MMPEGPPIESEDPLKTMFVEMFMAPDFITTEPGRILTKTGAEVLYRRMMEDGVVNLGRDEILNLTQDFGPELFQGMESATEN